MSTQPHRRVEIPPRDILEHEKLRNLRRRAIVEAAFTDELPRVAEGAERAVKLAERGVELDGSPVALIMLAQAYGYAGRKEKVLSLLEKAASAGTYICPYESAAAYLSIGDKERVMALLDEAVAKRSNCLIFLRNDPRLEPIRQHPHYAVLLNRVGLDDVAPGSYKR